MLPGSPLCHYHRLQGALSTRGADILTACARLGLSTRRVMLPQNLPYALLLQGTEQMPARCCLLLVLKGEVASILLPENDPAHTEILLASLATSFKRSPQPPPLPSRRILLWAVVLCVLALILWAAVAEVDEVSCGQGQSKCPNKTLTQQVLPCQIIAFAVTPKA